MSNEKEIQSKIDDALLRKRKGWTFGFDKLDDLAGRMEKGQVITLGGMTGTGKSYFVLNMIDGIRNEWVENTDEEFEPPKIAVFTTEMEGVSDELRHICMNAGVYWNTYKKNPELYYDRLQKAKDDYYANKFVEPNFLQIFQVGALEEVEKILKEVEIKPNIVIIDHVQNLTVKDKADNKDTMPVIGNRVRDIAKRFEVALICVSQINLSVLAKDSHPKKGNVQPFSWGKELLQSSHVAIFLWRNIIEGNLDSNLSIGVIKAREGNKGWFDMFVGDGFKLVKIS